MVLADSNVWLALALSKHEFHLAARAWIDEQSIPRAVYFCRATQQSFVRLLSTTAVLSPFGIPARTNKVAWSIYEGFLRDERIAWAEEPPELEARWKQLGATATASPKLWMDAYLAAFAITGGYQLVTTDKAFKHFKDLNVLVITN